MTSYSIGVSNVSRNSNGTRYTITDNENHLIGFVEDSMNYRRISDSEDVPITIGSRLYNSMSNAVKHYQEWAVK